MQKTPFPKSFKIFLTISIGLHGIIIFLLLLNWATNPFYWGGGLSGQLGVVTVVLMSPEAGRETKDAKTWKSKVTKEAELKLKKVPEQKELKKEKGKEVGVKRDAVSQSKQDSSKKSASKKMAMKAPSFGKGESPTPAGGTGDGYDAAHGASSAPDVLARIRQKILRAKKYPITARRRCSHFVIDTKDKGLTKKD